MRLLHQGRGRETARTVDEHLAVRDDGLDLSLLLKVLQALASQRAVDLQSVDEGGDGDETVGLDVLVQLLRGGLVENDGVLGLVLDCRQAESQRRYPIDTAICPKECVVDDGSGGINTTMALHHRHRQISHSRKFIIARMGERGRQSVHVPLPLDHFFFCFFPPVAAGAILTDLLVLRWRGGCRDVGGRSMEEVRSVPLFCKT